MSVRWGKQTVGKTKEAQLNCLRSKKEFPRDRFASLQPSPFLSLFIFYLYPTTFQWMLLPLLPPTKLTLTTSSNSFLLAILGSAKAPSFWASLPTLSKIFPLPSVSSSSHHSLLLFSYWVHKKISFFSTPCGSVYAFYYSSFCIWTIWRQVLNFCYRQYFLFTIQGKHYLL